MKPSVGVHQGLVRLAATSLGLAGLVVTLVGGAASVAYARDAVALDVAALIQGGLVFVAAGLFAMVKAWRVWQLRGGARREQGAGWALELVWCACLTVLSVGAAWLALGLPPWSSTPHTLHGPYFVSTVTPLAVSARIASGLLAIRLIPRLAAWSSSRRLPGPRGTAAIGSVCILALAMLVFHDADRFPPPFDYLLSFLVLDVALIVTLAACSVEALVRGRNQL